MWLAGLVCVGVLVVVYLMAAAVVRHKVNTMLADIECEVLEVVPTAGDTDLHFQAVVQVRAAVLLCISSLSNRSNML
jgi:hypothetical protein